MHDLIKQAHEQWHPYLEVALNELDNDYVSALTKPNDWLPKYSSIFAAFSKPLSTVRYILVGESPYPRAASANGYAFWDANVDALWQEKGLSLAVNRATSLRNFIKMLLHARGDLQGDFSQEAIAKLDKKHFIKTANALFNGLMDKGFLLLNASLIYQEKNVNYHARQWRPFMSSLLKQLALLEFPITLVLFGKIALKLPEADLFPNLIAEHPYNISFITNPDVLAFFKPLDLLNHDKNDH